MKKILIALGVLSLTCNLVGSNILAEDDEPLLVCHFEEDENGEEIEVCEEVIPSTYEYCSPECWNI